jgi:predicted hydrocarbon binding protein
VCAIDRTVIQQVLQANVEKTTCVLEGGDRCVFLIRPDPNQMITLGVTP